MRKAPIIEAIRDANKLEWCDDIQESSNSPSFEQSVDLYEDDGSFLDIPFEQLHNQSINQSTNPNFIYDFSPLIPRIPHESSLQQSINLLNVWARFQHRSNRSINGHCVIIQNRLITAFDVYRAVVERGGYQSVINQPLGCFHALKAAIMRAKPINQSTDPARIQSMPGGPPNLITQLRPRSFLIDYYERYLYHFEHAHQWKPNTAPLIDWSKPVVLQVIDSALKRSTSRRTVETARIHLLKSLWQPHFHKMIDIMNSSTNQSANPTFIDRHLGFVGADTIVKSLMSDSLNEITKASNELLELSKIAAESKDVDYIDEQDDGSDIAMLFDAGLIDALMNLLNTEDRHSDVSVPADVRPFQARFLQSRLASMWPDFHTVVLTIMNNLSQHRASQTRMSKHVNLVNAMYRLAYDEPNGVLPSQEEHTAQVAARILSRLTNTLDLKLMYRRHAFIDHRCDLFICLVTDALQQQPVDDVDEECARFLSSLTNLVLNMYSDSNIRELRLALPNSFFGAVIYMISNSALNAAPKTADRALDFMLFASLQDEQLAHSLFNSLALDVLTQVASENGTLPQTEQRRRTAAACIQAIVAHSLKDSWNHPWTGYEPIWSQLFLAGAHDADVELLLSPLLAEIKGIVNPETTAANGAVG